MRIKTRIKTLCAAIGAAIICSSALSQDDVRFDIVRFQVDGNSLLPQAQIDALIAPFLGKKRVYGDVQKALEVLENAYRKAGYGTVQVFVPEQELAAGVVRLVVTEAVVGKVTLTGNKFFDAANIHNTLPGLQEGKAPNMRDLSENIQLANENPAKQIEVTLGVAEEEGKVNAKVNVTDENPQRFIVTLDNTGTDATGNHRVGVAWQNANLFNSDQILTLAATTSAEKPGSVSVLSAAYRLPLYSIGDAIDIAYGKSTVNSPVAQATGLNIIGKGDVLSLRWNHYLPRQGEYTSKVILGLDQKNIESCVGPACTPVKVTPFSLAYAGQRMRAGELIDYNLSIAGSGIRRSPAVAGAPDDFVAGRLTASYMRILPGEWTARVALNSQYSARSLPDAEKFGVAGSTAVRGFIERALAGDNGYVTNFEVYTPELVSHLGMTGSLKLVAFADFGQGTNYRATGNLSTGISAVGIGLRYALGKQAALRLDLASASANGDTTLLPAKYKKDSSFALQLTF